MFFVHEFYVHKQFMLYSKCTYCTNVMPRPGGKCEDLAPKLLLFLCMAMAALFAALLWIGQAIIISLIECGNHLRQTLVHSMQHLVDYCMIFSDVAVC